MKSSRKFYQIGIISLYLITLEKKGIKKIKRYIAIIRVYNNFDSNFEFYLLILNIYFEQSIIQREKRDTNRKLAAVIFI